MHVLADAISTVLLAIFFRLLTQGCCNFKYLLETKDNKTRENKRTRSMGEREKEIWVRVYGKLFSLRTKERMPHKPGCIFVNVHDIPACVELFLIRLYRFCFISPVPLRKYYQPACAGCMSVRYKCWNNFANSVFARKSNDGLDNILVVVLSLLTDQMAFSGSFLDNVSV